MRTAKEACDFLEELNAPKVKVIVQCGRIGQHHEREEGSVYVVTIGSALLFEISY